MKRALFFALSLSLSLLVGYSLSEAQSRRKGSGKIRESPPSESTAPPTAQPEGRQPAQKAVEYISYSLQAQESRLSFLQRVPRQPPGVLENAKAMVVSTLERLGNAYQRAGDAEGAIRAYERGIAVVKEAGLKIPTESNLYQGLGQIYLRQKDFPRALENLKKALEIAEGRGQARLTYRAASSMGDIFLQTQRPSEAIPFYKKALDSIESTRSLLESEEFRSSFFEDIWKVNDRASYELMREFDSNLKTQKKSEALRQAQLKTMQQFPEPFFWAAYGLTGEP